MWHGRGIKFFSLMQSCCFSEGSRRMGSAHCPMLELLRQRDCVFSPRLLACFDISMLLTTLPILVRINLETSADDDRFQLCSDQGSLRILTPTRVCFSTILGALVRNLRGHNCGRWRVLTMLTEKKLVVLADKASQAVV